MVDAAKNGSWSMLLGCPMAHGPEFAGCSSCGSGGSGWPYGFGGLGYLTDMLILGYNSHTLCVAYVCGMYISSYLSHAWRISLLICICFVNGVV